MSQPFRLVSGGLIDRTQPLRFRFDGREYQGFAGDTLASALLANGARLIGRSFKYHRPRGVLTAGPEEPNAMVHLRTGARREPNTRATMVELYDGLEATSQHCWPSPRFDALAVNALLSPLFPAGFYSKTFMWPAGFWKRVYEPVIRRAAGLGAAATEPDPDRYEKMHVHVDVLVVGGGPAGIASAVYAGSEGMSALVLEDVAIGGQAGTSRSTCRWSAPARPVLQRPRPRPAPGPGSCCARNAPSSAGRCAASV